MSRMVFHCSICKLPDTFPSPLDQMNDISINSNDVLEVLSYLNPTKAAGCNELRPCLQVCATSLSEPVAYLFNKCLQTSTRCKEWKIYKMYPVPKKGDLSNYNNYSPIFLCMCVVSKVLEKEIEKITPPPPPPLLIIIPYVAGQNADIRCVI